MIKIGRSYPCEIGQCSLRGCFLIKITHVGGTLMILIFDGETSSK